MCYPVCGMMQIKEPLLIIEKSSPRGGILSFFPTHMTVRNSLCYTSCEALAGTQDSSIGHQGGLIR